MVFNFVHKVTGRKQHGPDHRGEPEGGVFAILFFRVSDGWQVIYGDGDHGETHLRNTFADHVIGMEEVSELSFKVRERASGECDVISLIRRSKKPFRG